MTSVIPQDIELTETLALELIFSQFPQFKDSSFKKIGEGFDNIVLQVGEDYVFRFPRRKLAVPLTEREIKVLGFLQGKLDLDIPSPQFLGFPTKDYPYPFFGHKLVKGFTGCQIALTTDQEKKAAAKLGASLKKLHSLDYSSLSSVDFTPFDDRTKLGAMLARFWERIEPIKKEYDLEKFFPAWKKIIEKASSYKANQSQCLLHGDLYHKHMVFSSEGELCGLIDWGDLCVNDPVVDFAVVYSFFSSSAEESFWQAYGEVSSVTKDYARWVASLYFRLHALVCYRQRGSKPHRSSSSSDYRLLITSLAC